MSLTSADRYDRNELAESQRVLVEWTPPRSSVLELGASTGYMSRALSERGATVVAVEYDPATIPLLSARASEAHVGNVEDPATLTFLEGRTFDTVILADVLEHLMDPRAALARCTSYLAQDGRVLVSMPNVAHWRVRLELLRGRWETTDSGIMDETHIRWFTRATAERMFSAAGFAVAKRQSVWYEMPFDARVSVKTPWLLPLKGRLNARLRTAAPEAFAGQFLWELVRAD